MDTEKLHDIANQLWQLRSESPDKEEVEMLAMVLMLYPYFMDRLEDLKQQEQSATYQKAKTTRLLVETQIRKGVAKHLSIDVSTKPEKKPTGELPGLDPDTTQTQRISSQSLAKVREQFKQQQQQQPKPVTSSLLSVSKPELRLIISGIVVRFTPEEDFELVIGRNDPGRKDDEGIFDVTPYGGKQRGVSRRHAKLHMDKGKLFITDLDSTNGTTVAGKRLAPFVATQLAKGNEIVLSGLPIQVVYRKPTQT